MENQASYNAQQRPSDVRTLYDTVQQQLFKMVARNLDFSPTPEDLPSVIQVMIEDLETRGLSDCDSYRVDQAFNVLGPHLQKWPTSRIVIEALPPSPPKKNAKMLIAPTPMDSYVDDYLSNNPMATKRDACMAFLKDKQLLKRLPDSLRDVENENESEAERKAIQDEVTGGI